MARVDLYDNYTKMPNALLLDKKISDGGKLFWVYISSKTPTWKYYDKNISKELGVSKETLRRRRNELAEAGYMLTKEVFSENGAKNGMDYFMFNKRSDRSEYAKKLKNITMNEDGELKSVECPTPQKCGERDPTDLRGLSKTNTKTNFNVADKSDDATPKAFTETMLEAIDVSTHLINKLSESIDNYKQPSIAGLHMWAKDIDLAIRLDNRTKQQLIDAINWIHDGAGSFWIGNIKSGKKLREQFDTLTAQRSPAVPKVNIRTRALEAFGQSKVFFTFKDTRDNNRAVKVCLYGKYNALYDYNRNEKISKDQADKVWDHIEKNFDAMVSSFKDK